MFKGSGPVAEPVACLLFQNNHLHRCAVSVALNCNIIAFAVEETAAVGGKSCQEVVNVEVVLTNPTVLFQEPPANVFGLGSTSVPVNK